MTKRIAHIVAMAVLTSALLVPQMAAAAPAASAKPWTYTVQAPWYAQWRPFAIYSNRTFAPGRGTGLEYRLTYVPEKNQVQLLVLNYTDKAISVTTPTSLTVDFALWQNGKLLWRASADKSFVDRTTTQTVSPGEGKIFKETLPYLPAGTYLCQAYFVGETKRTPVATSRIYVQAQAHEAQAHDPLRYAVEFLGGGWFNSSPRLRVTIKNASARDITLPYQYGYKVLVKVPGAKEYIGTVGIGESIGTIAAGATRYIFVTLDGLAPGAYQADVRSNVGGARSVYRIAAQTWFYIP